MTTDTRLVTAEEFMCLPDAPQGGKMELVHGEVVTMSPVGGEHGLIALRIGGMLMAFVDEHQLGQAGVEVGYRLQRDPDLLRAPDVSFLATSRLEEGRFPESFVEGPPTLAVEVISPSDTDDEVAVRVEDYLAAGTERVWVVRPRTRTVAVHRPNGDAHVFHVDETLTSDDAAFEADGFELPVANVFA